MTSFTLQIGVLKKIMANILSFHAYSSRSVLFFPIHSLMERGNRMRSDISIGKNSKFKAAVLQEPPVKTLSGSHFLWNLNQAFASNRRFTKKPWKVLEMLPQPDDLG